MADELTSLPVQSPLRITVRPYPGEMGDPNPYDFSSYLNSLPVEDPNQFQQIPPSGVGITRLPVKVEDAIKQAATENWVSRMIKSGVTLPKDVYEGKVDPLSEEGIERAQDLAGLNAAGPLAMKPGTATLGSGMSRMANKTQDAFHGSRTPGFERFEAPKEDFMIDRMLGTHVAKDPDLAGSFVTGQGSKDFGEGLKGGVYPLKIPHDGKFLEVPQELHPYITDRNTPKTSSNVNSDQNAIEMLVMKTAYKKDPELLARYLTEARAVPKEDALKLAKDMAAGKTVELPVDGKMDLDKFIRNFSGRPYNAADRVKAVDIFKKDMEEKGYEGLKYINTSPMETAGVKDPTSYVIFDPHKSIKSKYTNMLMAEGGKVGAPLSALAKEHFGITNNPKEAGYVLPDGSMLDLSGRNQQLDYYHKVGDRFVPKTGKDYMVNHRDVDHADLGYLYDEHNILPDVSIDKGGIRQHFMDNTGAIRNNPGIGFEASYVPTKKQLHNIVGNHNRTYPGEPLSVDLVIPGTNKQIAYKQFERPTVEAISKWINQQSKEHPDIKLFAEGGKVGAPLSALEKAPPFYSAVENAVKNAKQNSATADQWLGFLKNQPGVKPEELQYTLKDLPKGQISKADLERYIAENKVQLKEVKLGENYKTAAFSNAIDWFRPVVMEIKSLEDVALARKHNANFKETFKEWSDADLWKDIQKYKEIPYEEFAGKTKYGSYQLPGGENYKETLLTLPEKRNALQKAEDRYAELVKAFDKRRITPEEEIEWNALSDQIAKLRQQGMHGAESPDAKMNYRSSHWDEPNVLAHIRHNDRFIPDPNGPSINENLANPKGWHITPPDQTVSGDWMVKSNDYSSKGFHFKTKEEAEANLKQQIEGERPGGPRIGDKGLKTLHIEEIQSDWHQAGRKRGYASDDQTAIRNKYARLRDQPGGFPENDPNAIAVRDRLRALEAGDAVPDAPFKKTWDELALKRMIRQAAEQGYDAISWTPGEAQAARYDLSKQIKRLHYTKTDKGYILAPENNHGSEVPVNNGQPIPAEKLSDYIGKEIADKILKEEGRKGIQSFKEWSDDRSYGDHEGARNLYEKYKKEEEAKGDTGVKTLENIDLRIGGEGMKAFYDKMLVDKANAIAKKFGGKVETKDTKTLNIKNKYEIRTTGDSERPYQVYGDGEYIREFKDRSSAEQYIEGRKAGEKEQLKGEHTSKVHVLRITPELRQHALTKGFPLFSGGLPTLTPVDHNPFEPKLIPINYNPFENPNAT